VGFHDAEAQRQIQAVENHITSYEVYRSRPSDSELLVKGLARFMSFDWYAGRKQRMISLPPGIKHTSPLNCDLE
jgi:hypothetical protein